MNNSNIGENIKRLMDSKHISPVDLAFKLNITREAVYSILRKKDINTELLKNIAKALDIDIIEFFGGKKLSIDELSNAIKENEILLRILNNALSEAHANAQAKDKKRKTNMLFPPSGFDDVKAFKKEAFEILEQNSFYKYCLKNGIIDETEKEILFFKLENRFRFFF